MVDLMSCADTQQIAERLKSLYGSRAFNLHLAVTGAGSGLQDLLWEVPGASALISGASFRYDPRETERFIGRKLVKSVSELTAIQMAVASYFRAQETCLRGDGSSAIPVGFGLTAAVQTSRERKGDDHLYMAVRTTGGLSVVYVKMEKGKFGRKEQGRLCNLLALNHLLHAFAEEQVPILGDLGLFSEEIREKDGGYILQPRIIETPELPVSDGEGMIVDIEGQVSSITKPPSILFPGSFRPFHFGHDAMAMRVQELTGMPVTLEISRDNADKPAVPIAEILDRSVQFRGRWPVVITRGAPRMIDKARRFPGTGFVIGGDTADRILKPEFYRDETQGILGILNEFRSLGTKFYVVPRANGENEHWSFGMIPAHLADLFVLVPGRWDISSSKLRASVPEPRPPITAK